MTTKSLTAILAELRATKGSLAKAAILAEHKDREDFRRLVRLTYEPTISFYMKPNTKLHGAGTLFNGMEGCEAIYGTLASRRLTGNAAKTFYDDTMDACSPEAAALVNVMMDRDFRCGVGDTTIGKTWPGIITETPYMRCALPETAKIKKWPWSTPGFFAYSQPKADGMFANVTVDNFVTVTSRNGQTFVAGSHFEKVASYAVALASRIGWGVQLHGEFLVRKAGKILPRAIGNGIMNSLLNEGELDKDAELVYVFWDCVPLKAVAVKRYAVTYQERYEEAETALNAILRADPVMNDESDVFQLLPSRIVKTYAEAVEHFIELVTAGEEGTVVKKPDMIWFDGDSMDQVKMKLTFAVELRIKGFNAGNANGKHAKTFGSLQCESEDGLLATGVSGMSDALRKMINDDRAGYLEKIVTVSSNNVSTPTKSNPRHSMFLPRLEEIRHDKTVADDLASILAQFEAAKLGEEAVVTNPCKDIGMGPGMMCAGISWKQDPGGAECSAVVSYDIVDAPERYKVHAIHSHKVGNVNIPPSGGEIAFLQQVLNVIKEGGAPDKFCKDGLFFETLKWTSAAESPCSAQVYYQRVEGPVPMKVIHVHSITVGGAEFEATAADRDFVEMVLNDAKTMELK